MVYIYIYANIWVILMVTVTIYGIHTDPMGALTVPALNSCPKNSVAKTIHPSMAD